VCTKGNNSVMTKWAQYVCKECVKLLWKSSMHGLCIYKLAISSGRLTTLYDSLYIIWKWMSWTQDFCIILYHFCLLCIMVLILFKIYFTEPWWQIDKGWISRGFKVWSMDCSSSVYSKQIEVSSDNSFTTWIKSRQINNVFSSLKSDKHWAVVCTLLHEVIQDAFPSTCDILV
jgi:hypothetical protein